MPRAMSIIFVGVCEYVPVESVREKIKKKGGRMGVVYVTKDSRSQQPLTHACSQTTSTSPRF